MMTVILSLLLLIYFIRGQFGFERPKRWRYWLIPIFSLIMFGVTFKYSGINVIIALGMLILGTVIGMYQGQFATIRPIKKANLEDRVEVRGGLHYLIGWALILAIQVVAEAILKHEELAIAAVSKEAFQGVIEELFPLRRILGGGWWVLWALSASSSLSYTLTLGRRSPAFWATIKRHARRDERRADRKRM